MADKLTSGVITPAYGRDYKSKAEVRQAFDAGKDFVYHAGLQQGIVNKADFADNARVQARYGNIRKVCVLTVNAHGDSRVQ